MIVGVHVDDLVVAHNKTFKRKFKAEHLGKLSFFLGIGVDQHDDGTITIDQSQYIRDIAARFNLNDEDAHIQRKTPCLSTEAFNKLGPAEKPDDIAKT